MVETMKFSRISNISDSWTVLSFSGAKFCIRNWQNHDKHWDYGHFYATRKSMVFRPFPAHFAAKQLLTVHLAA